MPKITTAISVLLFCLVVKSSLAASLPGMPEFIDEMVSKHQFKRSELVKAFSRAEYLPAVIETISRQTVSKPWAEYRANFVNPERVRLGLKFWNKNQATLEHAEQQYGVPVAIIVAVIGVETIYGQAAGSYRTLDTLTTLTFDYPRRAEFFRSELENYLLLARDQQFDLLAIRGSYAGAIGIPQFMPSSYRNYAVDFDGDGTVDLLHEPGDAIGSVANYLKVFGWIRNDPVSVPATFTEKNWLGEITAARTLAQWSAVGVVTAVKSSPERRARLVDFTSSDSKEWWLVYDNFDVITRYNNSDYYAMVVFQLAEAIQAARAASDQK
ncbi:MAG: lytic murein transglycosylase B [Gallionella sp.]